MRVKQCKRCYKMIENILVGQTFMNYLGCKFYSFANDEILIWLFS